MTGRDFAYWLQGLFELAEPKTLNEKQTDLIKRHLALVFIHEIDPSHSNDPRVQALLQEVHDNPAVVDGPGVPPDDDDVDVNDLQERLESLEKTPPKQGPRGPRGPSGRSGGATRFMC